MDIYKGVAILNEMRYEDYLLHKVEKHPLVRKLPEYLRTKFDSLLYETYSRPIMLECETVNVCTNNCIVCPYEIMTRKKMTMPMKTFEKVLSDYSDIGGGYLTLTPKNGEVFLDELLADRLSILNKYPKIKGLSITTNAIPLDRLSDDNLKKIISHFDLVNISIYGLDREEYRIMTRRDFYSRMIANVNRIIEMRDERKTKLLFGFRFLKSRSTNDINRWIKSNFGRTDIFYDYTSTYMDWNGALDEKQIALYEGKWRMRDRGDSHCFLPLIAAIVYSNGDVSYCPCNDFDIYEEFRLGNIEDKSLNELFNSEKNKELWRTLPGKCLSCTSYRPMADLYKYADVFEDPIKYIGG